jgi:UDP-N-acetylmuramate dehydrogenase
VGAGVALPRLAREVARLGFSGFEFLAGIPGTVGAAVRLNAGAEGEHLAGPLRRVWVTTPQLRLLELQAGELGLGYRTSVLLHFPHWLVVAAEFALDQPSSPEAVRSRLRELSAARRDRQPANPRNCGSVFKNPANAPPAGRLIEEAGLKGKRLGGAFVSRKHANFFLNQGEATADQMKALIASVQETVWKTHGVVLEREAVFLPDDLA